MRSFVNPTGYHSMRVKWRMSHQVITALILLCLLWNMSGVVAVGVDGNLGANKSEQPGELSKEEAAMLSKHPYLSLNIGGIVPDDSWVNVNVQYDTEEFAYSEDNGLAHNMLRRSMDNLHGIADRSVYMIYSSHALEHTSSRRGETFAALTEWRRVLRPGGILFLAVPDLQNIALLYSKQYPRFVRLGLLAALYGGQKDDYDFHRSGFDEDLLTHLLLIAGFCEFRRVRAFEMFPDDYDASTLTFMGVPISLNLVARPCTQHGEENPVKPEYVDFDVNGLEYEPEFQLPEFDRAIKQFYVVGKDGLRRYVETPARFISNELNSSGAFS